MAKAFNLTAQINLQGPTNLKPVVASIRRELGTISSNVVVKLDARSAKSIDNVKNRLQSMNAVLTQVNANAKSLNDTFRSLSAALGSIQSSSKNVSGGINQISQNMQKVSKNIQVARTEMEEFGRQGFLAIKRFAAFSIVTGGVVALTSAITSGFKAFIQFDKELIKLQQVTGKGSLGIKELEKQITNLATSLGVSSESLTSVASTLAQAGLSAEDTRIALAALAKTELAPSFDNLTDTTEGAIAALRQFELKAGDLEAALGSINAVAAAFAVESKDIISAIQRTGGVFASASKGVSEGKDALNEFIAVFTSVRQTTRESAETIATGLRTIFTRIQRSSTIDLLKQYGVELRDLEDKFVGPFEAVKRLSAALNQLDPRSASFAKIVEELGGFRQIGKVIPLIQQFTTAQQALAIAQKGQSSLTDAQVVAQKSLANQIGKVREQFLALIRDVGQSTVFQGFFKIVVGLTSGLLNLASAFKPILPLLGIVGAIKGASAISQFATGFFGGFKKNGGPNGSSNNLGNNTADTKDKQRAEATARAADAIRLNTDALKSLTTAVNNLDNTIKSRPSTFNRGGKVHAFARGGVVPGSGNRDTVPAMLMPGEFVIRKKAVEKLGTGNLHNINKYATGGPVKATKLKSKAIQGRIQSANSNIDAKEFKAGKYITDSDTFTFEKREFGLRSPKNISFKKFEDSVGKRIGGVPVGGNAPIDIPENSFGFPVEVRNRQQTTKDNVLLDKLLRYNLEQSGGQRLISNKKTQDRNKFVGTIGVAYNTSKLQRSRFEQLNKGGKLGARKRVKDLNESELAQLSTADLIAYAKKQAFDIFSTAGAGMAMGHEFIEVPKERIVPELESELVSYMGKRGFWKEVIAPFGKLSEPSPRAVSKVDRQKALEMQMAKQADEVAAREQQWTQIRSGSDIDNYLLSSLKDPILTDYKTVRGGGSLGKQFHNTRLRKAVNEALEQYDDFDYSNANVDKFVSAFAAKRMSVGGLIQKFMAGGVAQASGIDESLLQRIKDLGGPGGVKDLVPDAVARAVRDSGLRTSGKLLDSRSLKAMPDFSRVAPYLEKVLTEAEKVKGGKDKAKQDQLANNMKAASGGAYQFGLVSLFGPNGELGYEGVSDAKELTGKNGEKFLTQIIRKSLPSRYAQAIKDTQADISGIPARAAARMQYTDIFGTGGPLAFDFDETLVKNADIYDENGQIDIRAYNDLKKVQQALADSQLTLLGKELAKRLIDYPELMDNIRVLTARPQSNAPYLASRLNKLGLPIPENKITGVSGGLNKVKNLSDMETLIDDNEENIKSVLGGGKRGLFYREPRGIDLGDASSRKSMAGMEGYALEEMVKSLGIRVASDDDDPNRPIDYPKGLGSSSSIWGIKSTLPTDTKRTNDSSALSRLWGEAQRYFVEKFAFGGEVGNNNFEKIKQQILDKYPEINFRISKRKKGFGYNILGGLKKEGNNIGNYADFQQVNSLNQLQEVADKVAYSLLYNYGPNIDSSLLKKKQKFANGGSAQDTVPALLTPGEFVVNKKAAQRIGYSRLHQMNKADKIEGFNKGGIVGGFQHFASGGKADDEAFLEYKARKEGTNLNDYLYGVSRQLGKTAYETTDMYGGRVQEMKYELAGKRDTLGNIGSTIRDAQADLKSTDKAKQAAAAQRLADAQSRLAIESENIAQQMKTLNPTLDMKEVEKAAKEIAESLSNGKLVEAQEKLVKTMGDAPEGAEAMKIAMERVAKELGLDASLLERQFGAGGPNAKQLKQQQFIQSREGQRFGAFAEFAPGLTERFSNTSAGRGLGSAADFIGGKGGKFSKLFARAGGITGIGGAVAVGAEALKNYLPSKLTSNANVAGALGGLSGAGSGAASGALLGSFAGPIGALIGGIGGAVVGGIKGYFSAKNTQILTNALDNVSQSASKLDSAFQLLEKESNQVNYDAAQKAFGNFLATSQEVNKIALSPENTNPFDQTKFTKERTEAIGAMVQNAQTNAQSAAILSQQAANKASTDDLSKALKELENGTIAVLPTIKAYQEAAIQAAEEQNGANVNLTESQKQDILETTKRQAALDAYTLSRKQSGATEDQINKELAKDQDVAIKQGEKIIQQNDILAKKQQLLSRAMKNVEVIGESLTNVFKRIGAGLTKFYEGIDKIGTNIDNQINDISGNADIAKVDRKNEKILSNITAYSMDEVKKAVSSSGSLLGGGEDVNKLGNMVLASKTVSERLPELLRTANPENVGDIVGILKKSVSDITGGPVSGAIAEALDQVSQKLESKTNGESNVSLSELAQDTGFLDQINEILSQGTETFVKLEKARNDALDKSVELQNKWIDVMSTSIEYSRKAAQIRIDSELELKKSLGQTLSLDQLNSSFNNNIASMTDGVTDPKQIAKNIEQLQQTGQRLTAERDQLRSQPDSEANRAALAANSNALQKNRLRLNDNINALKKLADSTDKAGNALSKLGEQRQRVQAGGGLIKSLVFGNAQSKLEAKAGFDAVLEARRALATNQTDIFSSPFFMNNLQSGLESIKDFAPKIYQDVLSQSIIQGLKQSGYTDQELDRPMDLGDGLTKSMRQLINESVKNEIDPNDPLVKAFKEAATQQEQANQELAKMNAKLAENIALGTDSLLKTLGEQLPTIVKDAFTQARSDIQSAVQANAPRAPVVNAPVRARGGMVDQSSGATKGSLVNFKPKGQDQYPYMLAKGEAVINAATTKKNPGIIGALLRGEMIEPGYAASGVAVGFEPDTTIAADRKKLRDEVNAQGAAYAAGTSEEYKKDKAELDSLVAADDEAKIRTFFFNNPQWNIQDLALKYAKSPYGANIKNWNDLAQEQQEKILAEYGAKFAQFHNEVLAEAQKDPLFHNRGISLAGGPEWQKMREQALENSRQTYSKWQDKNEEMHWKGHEDRVWNNETEEYENLGTYSMRPLSAEQKAREEEINRRGQLEYDRQIIAGEVETERDTGRLIFRNGDVTTQAWGPGEKEAAEAERRYRALQNVNKERESRGLPPLELPQDQIDPKLASEKAIKKQKLAENREAYLKRKAEKEQRQVATSSSQQNNTRKANSPYEQRKQEKKQQENEAALKWAKDTGYSGSPENLLKAYTADKLKKRAERMAEAQAGKTKSNLTPMQRGARLADKLGWRLTDGTVYYGRIIGTYDGYEPGDEPSDLNSLSFEDRDALHAYQSKKLEEWQQRQNQQQLAEGDAKRADEKKALDDKIAQSQKERDARAAAYNSPEAVKQRAEADKAVETQRQRSEAARAEVKASQEADRMARAEINPTTNLPYKDAAEKRAVEKQIAFDTQAAKDREQRVAEQKRANEENSKVYATEAEKLLNDLLYSNDNYKWVANYHLGPPLSDEELKAPINRSNMVSVIKDRLRAKYSTGKIKPNSTDVQRIVDQTVLDEGKYSRERQGKYVRENDNARDYALNAASEFGSYYAGGVLDVVSAGGQAVAGTIRAGVGATVASLAVPGSTLEQSALAQTNLGLTAIQQGGARIGARLVTPFMGENNLYTREEARLAQEREKILESEKEKVKGLWSTDSTTTMGNLLTPENVLMGAINTADVVGEAVGLEASGAVKAADATVEGVKRGIKTASETIEASTRGVYKAPYKGQMVEIPTYVQPNQIDQYIEALKNKQALKQGKELEASIQATQDATTAANNAKLDAIAEEVLAEGTGVSFRPIYVEPRPGQVNPSGQTGISIRGGDDINNALSGPPVSPKPVVKPVVKPQPEMTVPESAFVPETPQTKPVVETPKPQPKPQVQSAISSRDKLISQLSGKEATIYDLLGVEKGTPLTAEQISGFKKTGSKWLHPDLPANKGIDPSLQIRLNKFLDLASNPTALDKYNKGLQRGYTSDELLSAWKGNDNFSTTMLSKLRPDLTPPATKKSPTKTKPTDFGAGYSKGGMVTRNNGIHMPWLNNGDNMLATLRTGEGVVNAPAYAKYGTIVDAINRSKGGPINIPGFAFGTQQSAPVAAGPSGPLGEMYKLGLDTTSQTFMDSFVTAINSVFGTSFGSYVDKLAQISFPNIPDKIEMVGNHTIDVRVTGAAAFEGLSKEMQGVAEAIIRPKLDQLRDEISKATNGGIKSSAAMGNKGNSGASSSGASTGE